MTDLERLLRSSLEDVGEAYSPSDPAGAKERFLKRRRRRTFRLAFSGVAVTAAAVAAVLFVSTTPLDEDAPVDLAAQPEPVATIGVKEEPVAAIATSDGVWVVERGSGSVSRIDPVSNEVNSSVGVGSRPDEIAAGEGGDLWVSHENGSVTHFSARGTTISTTESFSLAEGDDVHLDLAVTPDALVAVDPDTGAIFEVSPDGVSSGSEAGSGPRFGGGFAATDVSYGPAGLWFLDGPAGEVRTGPGPGRPEGFTMGESLTSGKLLGIETVPGGEMSDLAVGTDAVWIANGTGGHLYRIDLGTGDGRSEIGAEIEVGGRYTDLAIGGGFVWALTGGEEPSVLRMIDETTGEVIGEPLTMEGRPTDVTFTDGSAWVTDGDGSQVVRVNPGPEVAPGPTPEGTTEAQPLVDPGDVVFVFSDSGDLYAETFDGSKLRLTDTANRAESNPTLLASGEMVYEVGTGKLERLDLATGSMSELGKGSVPAFGPDGRFAWVVNNVGENTEIAIGEPGGVPDRTFSAEACFEGPEDDEPGPAEFCPTLVRNLVWSPDGSAVYYEAGWEFGFGLYQLSLDEPDPQQFELGEAIGFGSTDGTALYVAPTAPEPGSITAVRRCCFEPFEGPEMSSSEHTFGSIAFTESGPEFEPTFDLEDVDPAAMVPLGTLTLQDGRWVEGDLNTWVITDGSTLWLVDETGERKVIWESTSGSGQGDLYRLAAPIG